MMQCLCSCYLWNTTGQMLKNMAEISKQCFLRWLQIKITANKSASPNRSIQDRKMSREKTALILLVKLLKSFDLTQEQKCISFWILTSEREALVSEHFKCRSWKYNKKYKGPGKRIF